MSKASRARRRSEQENLINQDRPDLDRRPNVPTGAAVVASTTSTEIPAPAPAVFKKGEATTAPEALVDTETVRGQTDFTSATAAGAVMSFLTGNVKPLVSALLLISLFCCLFFCLWMLSIDSEKGRLVWPEGYKDFSLKVLSVAVLFSASIALALAGYAIFRLFKRIQRWWHGETN